MTKRTAFFNYYIPDSNSTFGRTRRTKLHSNIPKSNKRCSVFGIEYEDYDAATPICPKYEGNQSFAGR